MINSGLFIKVKLVFDGWILSEGKTFDSKDTIEASMGSFHYGSTFNADLYLRRDEIQEIKEQIKKGLRPRFEMYLEGK